MSQVCEICGKHPVAGRSISHSHRVTNRTFRPNIQKVSVVVDDKSRKMNVCTSCMKAGKGVVGMAAPSLQDGIAKILPANRLRRGVIVTPREAGIHVDLYVVIEYGTNITVVSQNLIDNVTYVLNEFAQVPLDGIEVHVQGIKVRK